MMVRPGSFGSNPDTLNDNAFQASPQASQSQRVHQAALGEFHTFVNLLKTEGVQVDIMEDTVNGPDAIFPNNWLSFHSFSGAGRVSDETSQPVIVLYPMMSAIRRRERRSDIIHSWVKKLGAVVRDYTKYEKEGMYLEGTGSLVLDRTNAIAYACLSNRTHPDLVNHFCSDFGYDLVSFRAKSKLADGSLGAIYHTNVMMSVGTSFAVVCLDSIADDAQRERVRVSLQDSGKEIVPISLQQMLAFAGNVLQLRASDGHHVLTMSTQAYRSLSRDQLKTFSEHSLSIVHANLETIEMYGGGGARCMQAEVFPPVNNID